ncbi:MAG: hypothetical protein MN733_04820 [Nitrososphaera sp.]|nr:hypothetical protein [Nitrososphaera sp.]
MTEQDPNIAPLIPPAFSSSSSSSAFLASASETPVEKVTEKAAEKNEPVKPVHPLEPGGVRFQQIYARAKGAEEELETERERRIKAEIERDILKAGGTVSSTAPTDREYTNAELAALVIQGQATQDQVDQYKEQRLEKKISQRLRDEFEAKQRDAGRAERLTSEFADYTKAIPNIEVQGSDERKAVDNEFNWLVSAHGLDPAKLAAIDRQSLALNAVRNVFGPVTSIRQRVASPVGETHVGSFGVVPPVQKPNPDQALLNGLKPEQVQHYEKMMRAGRYPNGWSDVVAELKYEPPKAISGLVKR